MEISLINFWMILGVLLVIAEFILPGLISIFLGMGALFVALLLKLNYIDNLPTQIITWCVSSTILIFTLRLLVMKYYPMDTEKVDINEDSDLIGKIVEAIDVIPKGSEGRISFAGTTWAVRSVDDEDIQPGDKVKVIKRDNITWLVTKSNKEL